MGSLVQHAEQVFTELGWRPFPFQRAAWRAYLQGRSGLIHSATGTGKTLAVWMGPILQWLAENPDTNSWDPQRPPAPWVMWLTPLRALAGDTEMALRRPLEILQLPWSLMRRTGDSTSRQRTQLRRRLPTALITTPESLSVMLTHEHLQRQLANLRGVIVDEWHELLGTKRGIQTELALARLRKLAPELRVWGLSATLGNLDEALESLLGVPETTAAPAGANQGKGISQPSEPTPSTSPLVIQGYRKKKTVIESLLPETIDRFPWAGHIGARMVPLVAKRIEQVRSALIFANTRSQTEIWYQRLLAARPEWAGQLALHHGSLDTGVRGWVEQSLREEKLRAVVCTSSLDLGVDFTAVDMVVQVGSPKGAARLLQRAGRSGHQPDAESRLAFVPTHALELIELAAARDAIRQNALERKPLLNKPLDVLVQHVVTIAIGGGFQRQALLDEVRRTRAYESLTDIEWDWVLDFVVHGGGSLNAYPEFHRVQKFAEQYCVIEDSVARVHRLNIGTIVADAAMQVKYLKGGTLGTVEETFLAKLKPGDRFVFAGRVVEMVRIRDNVAYVKRSKGTPDAVPRWMGGRLPLSSELSLAMRQRLDEAARGIFRGEEMRLLKPLMELQERWSRIPRKEELLIERVKTRDGHQIFIFPFAGRLAHEGLAAVLGWRLSRLTPISFSMACNDYGIVLQSRQEAPLEQAIQQGLLSADNLVDDIFSGLNATEMCKRQFRQIARVAGLIRQGYPAQKKSNKQLQASSNLFFDVFQEFDPQNLLLEQSRREVLQQQLELQRLEQVLTAAQQQQVVTTQPPKVTPLAFPLLVDQLRERLSSETLEARVQKLQAQLEAAAGGLQS